ncbi:MAG: hypothetical protein ACRBC3_01560 [Burkholderiaceae bacterium]
MSDPVAFDWFDPSKTMDLIAERQKLYDAQDRAAIPNLASVPQPKSADEESAQTAQKPMSDRAQRWFDFLPKQVRPNIMRCKFPHILETLASVWGDPRKFDEELKALSLVDRGSRQGFPFAVIQELHCVRDYYFEEVNPQGAQKIRGQSTLTDQSR